MGHQTVEESDLLGRPLTMKRTRYALRRASTVAPLALLALLTLAPAAHAADMSADVYGTPASARPGDTVSFFVGVNNQPGADHLGVTVTITLPPGTPIRLVDGPPYTCTGTTGQLRCTTPRVGGGVVSNFRVAAVAQHEGPLPIEARVTTTSPVDPNPANDFDRVVVPIQLAAPRAGATANAAVVRGVVLVRTPGSTGFTRLAEDRQIPVGSTLDTRRGRVGLTTAAGRGASQRAEFYEGIFQLIQTAGGRPVTELRLTGPLAACAGRASAARRSGRHVWGSGRGRFRTRGRHSAATVRGTIWLVEDRCDGTTVTRVARGVVSVFDFVTRRTVSVRAGRSYVAGRR